MFPTEGWRFQLERANGTEMWNLAIFDGGPGYLALHRLSPEVLAELAELVTTELGMHLDRHGQA